MSKYEINLKIAQIQRLVEEKKYKKAAAVLSTIDVRQVRSRADLHTFAEIYMKTEQFAAAKAIYLRLYKKNRTRRILYRLIYLAIRTNELEEAEDFYQEFLGLSNNTRDNLILRYRIDKSKGVPISQLIDTLEVLKEEEYIEEWAYELAKLYQKAGRYEDCWQECQDIKLWFGQGEIVDRADMLLGYLESGKDLYYEDKDYTIEEEEPNPDDTGSLPDLSKEILEEEKERQKQKKEAKKEQTEDEDDFVDDYEEERDEDEGDMLMEPGELANMAKEGFMKLSGLWKRGNKQQENKQKEDSKSVEETEREAEEAQVEEKSEQVDSTQEQETAFEKRDIFPEEPQAPTGITQDLAKEIAAIFEAEHREQLKEKAVEVAEDVAEFASEVPNIATNVLDRMTQAVQQKTGKQYIPLNITEEPEQEEMVEGFTNSAQAEEMVEASSIPVQPEGMEEIVAPLNIAPVHVTPEDAVPASSVQDAVAYANSGEEVIMIELDKIMPEPDMPELKQVVPEDSPELGNQPELQEKELPTTKALHNSLRDILTLIAGEREPKHFVLVGEGDQRILGITKKIVRIMNKKEFLSTSRIAKIHAQQLNEMDLLKVCHQIKGSCLLIDGAAQLTFPTITKIFAVMDAFHGDFMVVLADEGSTLDELFRVAPALARRFEYVIDISQYAEEDYEEK